MKTIKFVFTEAHVNVVTLSGKENGTYAADLSSNPEANMRALFESLHLGGFKEEVEIMRAALVPSQPEHKEGAE